MGLLTFKGGIHPDDGKRFSKDQPIRPVVPQGELVYPLSQHIGAPAKPVVKKGDCATSYCIMLSWNSPPFLMFFPEPAFPAWSCRHGRFQCLRGWQ